MASKERTRDTKDELESISNKTVVR